jgi:S-adenosylmethionine hydrolase
VIPERKIITLTTDMGHKDHYVAVLKGSIYSQAPEATIVDVSHTVKPFDTAEAAYYVRSCYEDFPSGTVHIIGVDSEPMINFGGSEGSFPSVLKLNDQYFICTDNGFFGTFLEEREHQGFYRIDDVLSSPGGLKFPTKNILIPTAVRILAGEPLTSIGTEQQSFKRAFAQTAVIETNLIKGNVVHIDNFGNLITNIHHDLFNRFESNCPFTIYFRNKDYFIEEISSTYNTVPSGEKVAIFNSKGLLEIAINRGANGGNGGAEKLFGMRIGDVIRIEFTPRGSRETLTSLF